MLKIFTTQLSGLFKKIQDDEQESIDDAARLLAQALVGQGTVFLHGFKEMEGVISQAFDGPESTKTMKKLYHGQYMAQTQHSDRVLLFSRTAADREAVALAQALVEMRIPFVAVSGDKESNEVDTLVDLADIHINLKAKRGLVPDESGTRKGVPTLLTALYVFHALSFAIDDILDEYASEL